MTYARIGNVAASTVLVGAALIIGVWVYLGVQTASLAHLACSPTLNECDFNTYTHFSPLSPPYGPVNSGPGYNAAGLKLQSYVIPTYQLSQHDMTAAQVQPAQNSLQQTISGSSLQ